MDNNVNTYPNNTSFNTKRNYGIPLYDLSSPLPNSSSQPYITTSIKYIMHFKQVSERYISNQHSQIFTSNYHLIPQLSYELKLSTHCGHW